MTRSHTPHFWRTRGLVVGAIAVVLAAVWIGGTAQRDASSHGAAEIAAGQELLTNRLEMETGLRGFMLSGEESFLEPYNQGEVEFANVIDRIRERGVSERGSELLADQEESTEDWLRLALPAVNERRATSRAPAGPSLLARKEQMDRFREQNAEFLEYAEARSDARQQRALELMLALIVGLGLSGVALGYFFVQRPATQERKRNAEQTEFSEMLQFASDEREAHGLVRRQLERSVPGSNAIVLAINNSENRLQPATDLPEGSPLAAKLRAATPSSCLAIRRGKEFGRREGDDPLIDCALCGDAAGNSTCVPALVGGEIMGSVLVFRDDEMGASERDLIETTTSLAAPVLGNLRNLAVAETRAVTDSLTGLANARAATETLRLMTAFAGRSAQPLTGVMVDLDHFKQVNDTYGHQIGDEVLAAASASLKSGVRASDFVARQGGEEFLVLLQATSKEEGALVAEKMRRELSHLRVPGFAARITASFGVATLPDDAGDGDALLAAGDEALYAAKEAGRDRVMVASAEGLGPVPGPPQPTGNGRVPA
jgi:diguanylate cyclase (GGDEF)-like protein